MSLPLNRTLLFWWSCFTSCVTEHTVAVLENRCTFCFSSVDIRKHLIREQLLITCVAGVVADGSRFSSTQLLGIS